MQDGLKTTNYIGTSGVFASLSGTSQASFANVLASTGSTTTFNSTNLTMTSGTVTKLTCNGDLVFGAGSPFGHGILLQMSARSNISGGMWVSASGNLAYAAVSQSPIGVAVPGTNVASGGTVSIIVRGIVAMVAEGTIAATDGVTCGAGGALNCVVAAGAGSGQKYSVLSTASSGNTVFVML